MGLGRNDWTLCEGSAARERIAVRGTLVMTKGWTPLGSLFFLPL